MATGRALQLGKRGLTLGNVYVQNGVNTT